MASPEQVADLAQWLADRVFKDAWRMLPDVADREARGESYHEKWAEEILAQKTNFRALLMSPNFYHLNLDDLNGAGNLVNQARWWNNCLGRVTQSATVCATAPPSLAICN
jgi:hypothetical protein